MATVYLYAKASAIAGKRVYESKAQTLNEVISEISEISSKEDDLKKWAPDAVTYGDTGDGTAGFMTVAQKQYQDLRLLIYMVVAVVLMTNQSKALLYFLIK